jgi:glutaconate CoA-transferase subunit A
VASTSPKSLATLAADHVADGDVVFLGGFGHAVPFALGHELIRAGRKDLTICRSGADILADQLIAAGCVSKVVFGWIGNPDVGISHAFRRAVADGTIEWEEWTNWSMVLRLQAAASGVPFLPARVLLAGDGPRELPDLATVRDPYTGEELAAIPALRPDVALVHAQRADPEGNVQLWGIVGDTVVGALASDRIIVTVEEIVDTSLVRETPDRTVLPAHRVTEVVEVPWGAHPSYVDGYYTRDDDHFRAYDRISRTVEGTEAYLREWVYGVSRERYRSSIDRDALAWR